MSGSWRHAKDFKRFTGSQGTGSYLSHPEASVPWEGVGGSLLPSFRVFARLLFIPLWTSLATLAAAPFVGGTNVDKRPGFPRTGDFQRSSQGSPGQTQMTGRPRMKHTLATGNPGGQGKVHLGGAEGLRAGVGLPKTWVPALPTAAPWL